MAKRSVFVSSAALAAVLVALVMRATTLHSVNAAPLIYRATVTVNDLDSVEGLAPPGQYVELWVKQRNFREGNDGADPFSWCQWKNGGQPVQIATTRADSSGVWRLTNLRASGNTVMLFPPGPAGDKCLGGLYTELLPRACDAPGVNCTAAAAPKLHWLNVRKLTNTIAATTGAVSLAEQTAASIADGPNDGPEYSDVIDVDQNGFNTLLPGFTPGQRVTWICGAGGTGACPSIPVHDSSTAISTDPEYPFVLGTIQAHRTGGSFIAAAAIQRGVPIGFAVNVNVKFRGRLDVNLGCDDKKFFDFGVPLGGSFPF
jgi:hypothetical protein